MRARLMAAADISAVLSLARAMHAESPVYRGLAFDEDKVRMLSHACLASPDWLCAVAVTEDEAPQIAGMVVVCVVETFFGPDRMAEDLVFFVAPQHRGTSAAVRLIRMAETWAAAVGARFLRMGITTGTNTDSTARFLTRLGFSDAGMLLARPVSPLS